MMYRRNAAQTPRPDAKIGGNFAEMAATSVLDFLTRVGLYQAAHRENRQRNRAEKRAGRGRTYYAMGLNGARAVARRRRQRLAREAKAARNEFDAWHVTPPGYALVQS